MTALKIPPPDRRKHPSRYTSIELRAMLVDDGIHRRPLGGKNEAGLRWFTDAIARIAADERKAQEDVFAEIRTEIAATTGVDLLALA